MALAVYLKDNIFIIIQIKIFSSIYWNFLDALFKLISNYLGFPGNSAGKESACNSGDPSSIPGSGRSTGEGRGYLFTSLLGLPWIVSAIRISIESCEIFCFSKWGLSCPVAQGIIAPWPGIEPMSPALQGRFLTADHQGSPVALCWKKPFTSREAHVPVNYLPDAGLAALLLPGSQS